MKKTLMSLFVAWSFIFQSVAYAAKPVETVKSSSQYKVKLDQALDGMNEKYEGFSDKRKMRVLKRTKRKLKRAARKTVRMSDERFEKRMNKIAALQAKKEAKAQLESEEKELVSELKNVDNVKVKGELQVDKSVFLNDINDSLQAIEREITNLEYRLSSTTKTMSKRAPASVGTQVVTYAILLGLVVGSFFSTTILFIAIGVAIMLVLGFYVLGKAFAGALGQIVGQV